MISASTAAKLIWKLTPTTSLGAISTSASAPNASPRNDSARRPATIPSVTRLAIAKERMIGTCAPVSIRYAAPASSAATPPNALTGQCSAACGQAANPSRVASMNSPMMIPMCSPATASRCASPESRNAARSACGIDSVLPVSSVTATGPAPPGIAAIARRPIASRTPFIHAAQPSGAACDTSTTGFNAVPPPAMPLKYESRCRSHPPG